MRVGLPFGSLALLAALSACGEDIPTASGRRGPSLLTVIGGDGQVAEVGVALPDPLTVRLTNKNGDPVGRATVVWLVREGNGGLSASTGVTDIEGITSSSLTVGTRAGSNTVTAHVDGFPFVPAVFFTATGAAGPPATISVTLGADQTAVAGTDVPVAPAFSVSDAFGNPVPSVEVDVRVAAGQGSAEPSTVLSDTTGVAQMTRWTLGIETGTNILEGSVGGLTPVQISAEGIGFVVDAAVAGSRTSCGLAPGGTAYCWGQNVTGQVGDGTTMDRLTPIEVAGGHSFSALTAGGSSSCGLDAGRAWCWGGNLFGSVGDGTIQNIRTSPVEVVGGLGFAGIEGGGAPHTCGWLANGDAHCWGNNEFGNLGDLTDIPSSSPVPVLGGLQFVDMEAGIHTCGLTESQMAYCWGPNDSGQLGDGTTTDRWEPTAVAGGLPFTQLAAGLTHTCGLTSTGPAYCWGRNDRGQLGDGTQADRSTPTPVSSALRFASITAGRQHTCALTGEGEAYCWGANLNGELGDETRTGHARPAPVATPLRFLRIESGYDHTCAVALSDVVYCWGDNGFAQLGDGTLDDALTPRAVRPPGL